MKAQEKPLADRKVEDRQIGQLSLAPLLLKAVHFQSPGFAAPSGLPWATSPTGARTRKGFHPRLMCMFRRRGVPADPIAGRGADESYRALIWSCAAFAALRVSASGESSALFS